MNVCFSSALRQLLCISAATFFPDWFAKMRVIKGKGSVTKPRRETEGKALSVNRKGWKMSSKFEVNTNCTCAVHILYIADSSDCPVRCFVYFLLPYLCIKCFSYTPVQLSAWMDAVHSKQSLYKFMHFTSWCHYEEEINAFHDFKVCSSVYKKTKRKFSEVKELMQDQIFTV